MEGMFTNWTRNRTWGPTKRSCFLLPCRKAPWLRFRKRLRSGEEIPEWFAFPKVVQVPLGSVSARGLPICWHHIATSTSWPLGPRSCPPRELIQWDHFGNHPRGKHGPPRLHVQISSFSVFERVDAQFDDLDQSSDVLTKDEEWNLSRFSVNAFPRTITVHLVHRTKRTGSSPCRLRSMIAWKPGSCTSKICSEVLASTNKKSACDTSVLWYTSLNAATMPQDNQPEAEDEVDPS